MTQKKYNIGLDIGTTSVGWAVTGEDYSLLKRKGKNLWGVRLFEEGQTAASRRLSRGSRRRLKRRRGRIALLRQMVGEMVLEKDSNFFFKLDNGFKTKDDKGYEFNLFNDSDFRDVDFYNEFKTIYHLRKHLCETSEKADPRLIYLALHHIVKYRGNFIYEGQKFALSDYEEVNKNIKKVLAYIFAVEDEDAVIGDSELQFLINILKDSSKPRGEKRDLAINLLGNIDSVYKKVYTEFIKMVLDFNTNLTTLFYTKEVKRDDKKFETNFSATKYEEDEVTLEGLLGEKFEILLAIQSIYSFLVLQGLMMSKQHLYDAMIDKYESHKYDLNQLKTLVKKNYAPSVYTKIFRDETKYNYNNYINETKAAPRDEFYKFIKKELEKNTDILDTVEYKEILSKMDRNAYMPKQVTKDNGAIPYQVHEMELETIINNQGIHYPKLVEMKDDIIRVFKFRIPYYVGPLNSASDKSWMIRKEEGVITPLNFEEKVDRIQSAEKFIRRMTNCCSYYIDEPVVPKKSLLYSKYEVLNELNNIRINGKSMDVVTKRGIIETVFMKKKAIKLKDIEDFYRNNQLMIEGEVLEISGTSKEGEFSSNLEPWIDFKKIYGDDFEKSYLEIEKIIEWITVYEDKRILKERILLQFPHLNNDQVKMILKKKYTGWGRLSRELLEDTKVKDQFNEWHSIMDVLEEKNFNFQKIITHKQLGFKEAIEEKANIFDDDKIKYEHVEKLQGSPAIKRGIWQSILIVEELVKVMKCQPDNIFIEFARSDEESARTQSRVSKLLENYKNMMDDGFYDAKTKEVHNELKKEISNSRLESERKYLYYIQNGKCMYSGETLDFDRLSEYEVDHIVPQSYVKDDSLENKVLVKRVENQYKGDKLFISQELINERIGFWKHLLKYKLIGPKKFKNLTTAHPSDREELGFINRQLVETRQITKHVANLLNKQYEDTNIVSIKAGLGHDFRLKYNIYKIRELNDYHHAHDAYIASIIGNYVLRKYPVLRTEFIFTDYNYVAQHIKDLNKNKKNKFGFIINQLNTKMQENKETGEIVWDGQDDLNKVLKAFDYKDCFISKKLIEKDGQLFNLTLLKVKGNTTIINDPHKVIPVNKDREDITKYGGFMSLEKAYGIAVEYTNARGIQRVVVDLPMVYANRTKEEQLEYLKKETKSDDIKIIKDKILYNQLIEVEGSLFTMASASEWNNARQLLLSKKSVETLYHLFNSKEYSSDEHIEEILGVYDEYIEKLEKYYPIYGNIAEKLKDSRDEFINSDQKITIIKEMLNISKANAGTGAFGKLFDSLSDRAGRLTGKSVKLEKTDFISQSVTGIYTNKYKL